jgi:hypothetical protein
VERRLLKEAQYGKVQHADDRTGRRLTLLLAGDDVLRGRIDAENARVLLRTLRAIAMYRCDTSAR